MYIYICILCIVHFSGDHSVVFTLSTSYVLLASTVHVVLTN